VPAAGPAFRQIDLSISKLVPFGTQRIELRIETFNLFNTFNWGDPVANFNSATFGRITTQAETPAETPAATPSGDKGPRILQFEIKYDF
jgi:hypothetical protein